MTHSDSVRQGIQDLRRHRAAHLAQRQAIASDPRFSDAYKAQLTQELVAKEAAELKALSQSLWSTARTSTDALRLAAQRAHATYEAGRDHAEIGAAATRYKSLFNEADDPFGGSLQSEHILQAYETALELGDQTSARGIRQAALDLLGTDAQRGQDGSNVRAVLRRMRQDEANDAAPELGALRTDLQDVQTLQHELASEILQLEATVTGARHDDGAFHMLSDWEREILGRSTSEHVHWKQPASPFNDDDDGDAA